MDDLNLTGLTSDQLAALAGRVSKELDARAPKATLDDIKVGMTPEKRAEVLAAIQKVVPR